MITPYEEEHYEFLKSILYEIYNEETRNRLYDFYAQYGLRVWLPRDLTDNNSLEYIVEYAINWYTIKFKNGEFQIWRINDG